MVRIEWDPACRIPLQVANHPIRGSNSDKPHNNNNHSDEYSSNNSTNDDDEYPGPPSVSSLSFTWATLLLEH